MMKIAECFVVLTFLVVFASCDSLKSASEQKADSKQTEISNSILKSIETDSVEGAYSYFGSDLKSKLDLVSFKASINNLEAQVGGMVSSDTQELQFAVISGFECVFIKCQFEQADLFLKLVFNDSNEVVGIFFVPEIM